MIQMEIRDESLRRDCEADVMRHDQSRDQYGRGEERAARALDCIASAMYSWSTKAWRLLFQVCFPKDDARLMLTVVLAVLLWWQKLETHWTFDVTSSRSSEGVSGILEENATQSSCAGITRIDSARQV